MAAVIFATLLATQGAIVRALGAGLGCPDWPLCHGALTPPPGDTKALIEYIHRIVAGIGGLVIVAAGVAAIVLANRSLVRRLGVVIVLLLVVQVLLGAVTVLTELPPWIVTIHLGTASVLIGLLTTVAVVAQPRDPAAGRADARLLRLAGLAAGTVLALIIAGGFTSASGAGGVCPDWPLCEGQILPLGRSSEHQLVHMLHRLIAAAAAYALFHLALAMWRRRRAYPVAARLALIALALASVQIAVGAFNAIFAVPAAVTATHSFLAQWLWVSAVAAVAALWAFGAAMPNAQRAAWPVEAPARSPLVRDLIALTKPRIVAELLVTTIAAMIVAARGLPAATVVVATLIGGTLAAGAAAVFNGIYDRDIDRLMLRTRERALPAERVAPRAAAAWGVGLFLSSILVLWLGVSWIAAALAAGAFAIYVGVYTVGLKRRSTQNIVIGGAAGAIPPMVGWVAGAGQLELGAVVLFAIVFLWTPPHFWALALVRKADYARAGIPMLPVARGDRVTRRHIFIYTLVLVGTTLVLAPVNAMGWIYAVAALVLGLIFVQRAWLLMRARTVPAAERLFKYSITYLTVLFAVMVLDVLVGSAI